MRLIGNLTVSKCKNCPLLRRDSDGNFCFMMGDAANHHVDDIETIPPWCELEHHSDAESHAE